MKHNAFGDIVWLSILLIITAFLVLPQTHQVFIRWSNNYPYWMGFVKFAILASMGELLALRLAYRTWKCPVGMVYKIIVWGILGMVITFMFSFYSTGVSAMMEQGKFTLGMGGYFSTIYTAFMTSVMMNLTFGIVFMAVHRISDTYIEMQVDGKKTSFKEIIQTIDWDAFITFVVFKTIPLFWIPAHTITFTLPAHYRVLAAAYLSIILGVFLAYSKSKQTNINKDLVG